MLDTTFSSHLRFGRNENVEFLAKTALLYWVVATTSAAEPSCEIADIAWKLGANHPSCVYMDQQHDGMV